MTDGGPTVESLGSMRLFRGLEPDQLERLASAMHARTFSAGIQVIVRDQPGDVVYLIERGSVKVFQERRDGGQVILALLGPGEVVGEMAAIDESGRSANVATLEESRLLWIDRTGFRVALREMPLLSYNLVSLLSRRLRLANSRLETIAAFDVKGRVARQLLALAVEYGDQEGDGDRSIPIPLTQSDLGALVGASRARVNHALTEFRQAEAISIDRHHRITIHDWSTLARRAR